MFSCEWCFTVLVKQWSWESSWPLNSCPLIIYLFISSLGKALRWACVFTSLLLSLLKMNQVALDGGIFLAMFQVFVWPVKLISSLMSADMREISQSLMMGKHWNMCQMNILLLRFKAGNFAVGNTVIWAQWPLGRASDLELRIVVLSPIWVAL